MKDFTYGLFRVGKVLQAGSVHPSHMGRSEMSWGIFVSSWLICIIFRTGAGGVSSEDAETRPYLG